MNFHKDTWNPGRFMWALTLAKKLTLLAHRWTHQTSMLSYHTNHIILWVVTAFGVQGIHYSNIFLIQFKKTYLYYCLLLSKLCFTNHYTVTEFLFCAMSYVPSKVFAPPTVQYWTLVVLHMAGKDHFAMFQVHFIYSWWAESKRAWYLLFVYVRNYSLPIESLGTGGPRRRPGNESGYGGAPEEAWERVWVRG